MVDIQKPEATGHYVDADPTALIVAITELEHEDGEATKIEVRMFNSRPENQDALMMMRAAIIAVLEEPDVVVGVYDRYIDRMKAEHEAKAAAVAEQPEWAQGTPQGNA